LIDCCKHCKKYFFDLGPKKKQRKIHQRQRLFRINSDDDSDDGEGGSDTDPDPDSELADLQQLFQPRKAGISRWTPAQMKSLRKMYKARSSQFLSEKLAENFEQVKTSRVRRGSVHGPRAQRSVSERLCGELSGTVVASAAASGPHRTGPDFEL
jgi:hypothetical protein